MVNGDENRYERIVKILKSGRPIHVYNFFVTALLGNEHREGGSQAKMHLCSPGNAPSAMAYPPSRVGSVLHTQICKHTPTFLPTWPKPCTQLFKFTHPVFYFIHPNLQILPKTLPFRGGQGQCFLNLMLFDAKNKQTMWNKQTKKCMQSSSSLAEQF